MNYWEKYYNNPNLTNSRDLQKNVGRTQNGKSIDNKIWDKTLKYIENLVFEEPRNNYKFLDLCCGNGQILGNIQHRCEEIIGVDYSSILLSQLKESFFPNKKIKIYNENVLSFDTSPDSLDVIVIYFSIQHFNEKETIILINNAIKWLKKGGVLFIGDIPDIDKKWTYIKADEHRADYFQRLLDDKPKIGNWFQKDFFMALSSFFKAIEVTIIEQPSYQINSNYRFDVKIKKL